MTPEQAAREQAEKYAAEREGEYVGNASLKRAFLAGWQSAQAPAPSEDAPNLLAGYEECIAALIETGAHPDVIARHKGIIARALTEARREAHRGKE